MFYTYLWLRDDGTPYYVGKGRGLRAFCSKAHTVRRPKDRAKIIIFDRSSEQEAFATEQELIANWGRLDLGTGCLHNRTDGGEGGCNVSLEARQKRSEAAKRQWENPKHRVLIVARAIGKHPTLETRAKMSAAKLGKPTGRKGASEQCRAAMRAAWVARKARLASGEEIHWTKRATCIKENQDFHAARN